jgi:undecaprenyl-diphosphatase
MEGVFAPLALFAAVAAATFFLPSHPWDAAVTAWVQRAAPGPDVAASIFVFLGDAEIVIPAVVLVGVFLWPRSRAAAGAAWWLAAALVLLSGLALGLKFTMPHPGPPPEFQRSVARFGVAVTQPFSFPSGHTMRTACLGFTVLRRAPAAAALLIIAMMSALVYLGDHWMSDVLGGLCLGWAGAEAVRAFRRPR